MRLRTLEPLLMVALAAFPSSIVAYALRSRWAFGILMLSAFC
jgi:hypothetical protein